MINDIIDFYKNNDINQLSYRANNICEQNYGNKIFIRGLLEFSNYCNCDCLYCGIRKSNINVKRYRLTVNEILQIVEKGYSNGIKTFVLQSGEDYYYTTLILTHLVAQIKKITNNSAAITLSCGIKSKDEYRQLKKAGTDRYLLRFETSDPDLHHYLRDGISLKRRLVAIDDLKECGYEVGSGYMVGLPDETEDIRINNAILCKKLELDMIGIGPFIPHHGTPLKNNKQHPIELVIKATALIRMLLPEANIPATTAAGSLDHMGREKVLSAGANVLMPNITPENFKKYYLLYPGKICLNESGFECITCLEKKVATIGKTISLERGDSNSKKRCN